MRGSWLHQAAHLNGVPILGFGPVLCTVHTTPTAETPSTVRYGLVKSPVLAGDFDLGAWLRPDGRHPSQAHWSYPASVDRSVLGDDVADLLYTTNLLYWACKGPVSRGPPPQSCLRLEPRVEAAPLKRYASLRVRRF
jgi:hypothetical protein